MTGVGDGTQDAVATTPAAASPQAWLQATPRGAYTTLLVRGPRQELVDWPTHLERLLRSLRAMHQALGMYSRYYGWLAVSTLAAAAGAPSAWTPVCD